MICVLNCSFTFTSVINGYFSLCFSSDYGSDYQYLTESSVVIHRTVTHFSANLKCSLFFNETSSLLAHCTNTKFHAIKMQ